MSEFALGQKGLRLESPSAGDIVTVKLKPCPKQVSDFSSLLFGGATTKPRIEDESTNPHHYRHTNVWRVLAVNGGQAVVEGLRDGYNKGKREVWAIDAHDWFEASELWEALQASDDAT